MQAGTQHSYCCTPCSCTASLCRAVLLLAARLQGRALGVAAAVAATAYSTTVIPNQAANFMHLLAFGIMLVGRAALVNSKSAAAAHTAHTGSGCRDWQLHRNKPVAGSWQLDTAADCNILGGA